MAAKGKLDDMLSGEGSKPIIRRGQGMRLSTEEPPAQLPAAQDRIIAKTQKAEVKRVNRGYMLREDLVIGCKRIALDDGRKLYQVMEDALAEYLSRRSQAAQ